MANTYLSLMAHNRLLWRTHIHLLSHSNKFAPYSTKPLLRHISPSTINILAFHGTKPLMTNKLPSMAIILASYNKKPPTHKLAFHGTYPPLVAHILLLRQPYPSPIITKAPVAVHICLLWHIFGFHSLHYLPLQICYFFVGRLHHQVIQNSYIIDHLVMAIHDPIVEYTSTIFPTMEGSKRFPILAHINMLPI